MTDRKLMQQALDALIETVRLAGEYGTHLIRNDKDAGHAYTTIEALRARLAQPECEWQGLTDDELDEINGSPIHLEHSGLLNFARAIETKLKEKNNDSLSWITDNASYGCA